MRMMEGVVIILLILVGNVSVAHPQTTVETLPGFAGRLPFKLETGYVGVGEEEEVQLFYYFVESERDEELDPLLLWITGGPGCSGFSGLVFEIGPLNFDSDTPFHATTLPSLRLNPYSWTKIASIIFIDQPVGTGFSYATIPQAYDSSDTLATQHIVTFLRKWLIDHPKFIKNRLYITGDSYGGKFIPTVAWEIQKGNEKGIEPRMSLQGYTIGNPVTHESRDQNSRIRFAHRMALISDAYYEIAKNSCDGEYVNIQPDNYKCLYALQPIQECINGLFSGNILEPKCKFAAPKPHAREKDEMQIYLPSEQDQESWCRNNNYVPAKIWANDPAVQQVLGIRNGSKSEWMRCNLSLSHVKENQSVVPYHQLLTQTDCQVLIYSGDHDLNIPYIGTLDWIRSLNLTIDINWKPWLVNGQVAGYTELYTYKEAKKYYLTFATIKGAGHTAPEYRPKECLAMLERWLSYYPL